MLQRLRRAAQIRRGAYLMVPRRNVEQFIRQIRLLGQLFRMGADARRSTVGVVHGNGFFHRIAGLAAADALGHYAIMTIVALAHRRNKMGATRLSRGKVRIPAIKLILLMNLGAGFW